MLWHLKKSWRPWLSSRYERQTRFTYLLESGMPYPIILAVLGSIRFRVEPGFRE